MNAFELLKADHRKVAELFDQLESASGNAKLKVFKQIKTELELHTHIEEKFFYPELERPRDTHDLTLEAYEEHKVVKTLLAELSRARTASDEWQAKAKVLRENVEHHVNEEENELFDKADDVLSEEEVEALGDKMASEKARKQGRPVETEETVEDDNAERGILGKIADFVGLGSGAPAKKAAKRKPAKKAAAKKTAAKKAAAKKVPAKKATKSAAKKSASASATKRTGRAPAVAKKKTTKKSTKKR